MRKPEGEWLKSAPIRRLSFDIECCGRKGIFPEPEHDSVIQIANYLTLYGTGEEVAKVVFTLQACAPIAGATIISFDTEKELLRAWYATTSLPSFKHVRRQTFHAEPNMISSPFPLSAAKASLSAFQT